MMNTEYKRWLELAADAAISQELNEIKDSPERIEDAFYRSLEFGTGGLRGELGAGTNRMNIYTVGRASLGLAGYVVSSGGGAIAIGYDTRINSRLFAERAAQIFASKGLSVYLYSEPLPTPMLSYAVRELGCAAGVMITASHNPKQYNGYKVYGSDGCQITDAAADKILAEIEGCDYFDSCDIASFDSLLASGAVSCISPSVFDKFIDEVSSCSMLFGEAADKSVRITYTNLNGTGRVPVLKILEKNGFSAIKTVKEQEVHDGEFPTCQYPNPELPEALTLGLEYAKKNGSELLLATDPDCDRVGVAVKCEGGYKILTGNEVGLLLLDYVASQRARKGKMPSAPICVKTIVTSELAVKIAKKYGVETVDVLTGFKYIGEQIGELEKNGEADRYIFGFEESCGYLGGSYVRDKDGVYAALLISELAAHLAAEGSSLYEKLSEIYREHGYAKNSLYSYYFDGKEGFSKMQSIMDALRCGMTELAGLRITTLEDYQKGIKGLPVSNVLKFFLENDATLVVRPSGTEPKLKIYISVTAEDECEADKLTAEIKSATEKYFK